jgi:hypothetical protein
LLPTDMHGPTRPWAQQSYWWLDVCDPSNLYVEAPKKMAFGNEVMGETPMIGGLCKSLRAVLSLLSHEDTARGGHSAGQAGQPSS